MINLEHKLNKLLKSFLKKLCINREEVTETITEASRSNTYVETVNSKLADSLHLNVSKNYADTITSEFFRFIKPKILNQRFGLVDLVADITEENFYGKHSGLYIHGWTGERGIVGKIRYLVVAILYRNKIIPFYIEILSLGAFKAESLGKAIHYCNSLGLKIRNMFLDRGFYSGDIINTLQINKVNYLIFVPKNKFIKRMIDEKKEDCIIQHEIKYTKEKSVYKAISDYALIHDYLDYVWVFATNIKLKEITKYVSLYKKRWNIETMFRVHDEAKIKSKSVKPEIRLFYFVVSMLLLLIWNLYYKTEITFKKFVIDIHKEIELELRRSAC